MDLTETQTKLAQIWRNALALSKDQYETLTQDSDFSQLAGWETTIPGAILTRQIQSVFGITPDSSFDEDATLKDQATWIDLTIDQQPIGNHDQDQP